VAAGVAILFVAGCWVIHHQATRIVNAIEGLETAFFVSKVDSPVQPVQTRSNNLAVQEEEDPEVGVLTGIG